MEIYETVSCVVIPVVVPSKEVRCRVFHCVYVCVHRCVIRIGFFFFEAAKNLKFARVWETRNWTNLEQKGRA